MTYLRIAILALLAVVGPAAAQSTPDFYSSGGGGGGAATSLTSGTTTCVSGATGHLVYVKGTPPKVICDATGPTWNDTTGLLLTLIGTGDAYIKGGNQPVLGADSVATSYSYLAFLNGGHNFDIWSFGDSYVPGTTHLDDQANGTSLVEYNGNLVLDATGEIAFGTGGQLSTNKRWRIDSTGNFIAVVDGGPDIGASGATRPNNGYFKTDVIINGNSVVTSLAGKSAAFTDSAGLAALLSDETGTSGGFVRAGSPTLTSPALGTPSALVLTNASGLPESGVTNLTTDLAAKAPLRTIQTATCADSGDGSLSTLTLTPSGRDTRVRLTNSDADGCTVTMGEGSAQDGDVAVIVVVSNAGGTANFADTSGVSELSGAFNMDAWDSLTLDYVTDRWVERTRSNN